MTDEEILKAFECCCGDDVNGTHCKDCPAEKYNFDWCSDEVLREMVVYIKRLKAENATLHERLDKTIELPCKVGDTIYEAAYSGCIQEWIVTDISYKNYGQDYEFRMNCESKNDSKSCRPFIKRTHWNDFEGIGRARFTRVAAEARLKELQGEENG